MKLLTRSIYALLFIGISLVLNASVEPIVSIRVQNGQSFSIHLKDMEYETLNIQLVDNNNYVLLNEKVVDKNDYLRLFNLKNLPVGNYKLRIEDDRKIIFQDINVFKERLTIDPTTKRELIKPKIQHHSSYLDLNLTSYKDEIIEIKIRDENSEVLHQEKIDEVGSIHKRFNIAALPAGSYIVKVITYDYTYEQEFTVELGHPTNLKTLAKKQKDTLNKIQANIDTTKNIHPYIMNRIKWINSRKN